MPGRAVIVIANSTRDLGGAEANGGMLGKRNKEQRKIQGTDANEENGKYKCSKYSSFVHQRVFVSPVPAKQNETERWKENTPTKKGCKYNMNG